MHAADSARFSHTLTIPFTANTDHAALCYQENEMVHFVECRAIFEFERFPRLSVRLRLADLSLYVRHLPPLIGVLLHLQIAQCKR